MGIQRIEVYEVTLRYKEPFVISAGTSTENRNTLVKIITDYDVFGWGEASPSKRVTNETPETILKTLDKIGPRLIGMCPLRIAQDVDLMDTMVAHNPSAKAAIDLALHDVLGKTARKPTWRLLGGFREKVLTDITLSIKSPKEMAKDAVKAVKMGFKALKVKVGVNPKEDVERIKLIRKAVGPETAVRIDANQGWTVAQAIDALKKLDKFHIQFVEQPIEAKNIRGLAKVRKESPIPVMADESVHSPIDALKLIKANAVDMINIKLMKSGGIHNARKIAHIAEAANVPCMIGCMGESAVGITAAVHFAAATKDVQHADLDCDILLADKLVSKGGAELKNSERIPNNDAGYGIAELDEQLLGKPVRVYGK
ncbi:MAG: mandelate racemase/muconate lactonizing enzyme family protein [Candidatus Bathyarchaeales archaeon]